MNYSRQYIGGLSSKTSFQGSNIEKVIRLLEVLDFIFEKSSFKDALLLKGGTAINLLHTDLRRLSLDIDLDYVRHLEKTKTMSDRITIMKELDDYMRREGYDLSDKSRESAILSSKTYSYTNASGNKDNIKVEINFINRMNIYPKASAKVSYFGKEVHFIVPAKEELFGMKIAALIHRSKPRDLYDVNHILQNLKQIDAKMLKKAIIFYLSLDGIFQIDDHLFDGIKSITISSVKRELLPVLRKGEKFDLKESQSKAIGCLSAILCMDENESRYLSECQKGLYNPTLLFDECIAERIKNHPMAQWRALNIKG